MNGLTAGAGKLAAFISYSRDDLDFADQLDAALKLHSFSTTIDRQSISGGEDWKRRLGGLIRDADTVVFVLSPASARSEVCRWEVTESVRLGKRIVPILCRDLDGAPLPTELAELNYILFFSDPKFPGSGFGTGLARLVTALNTDLDWLREHTRLLQRATEWEAGGRPANRLLSGDDVVAANAWAARRPREAPPLTAMHLDFIKASEAGERERQSQELARIEERERLVREAEADRKSREAAQEEALAQARRVVRRTRAGLASALLLASIAGAAGYYAWGQAELAKSATVEASERAEDARRQAALAEAQRRETEKVKEQAQRTESGLLANTASRLMDKWDFGDPGTSALLALAALPDEEAGIDRPYVGVAEVQLERAGRALNEEMVLVGHTGRVSKAIFSPDGRSVLTLSDDATARIWPAEPSLRRTIVLQHGNTVWNAAYSDDGSRIITASGEKIVRIWNADTGQLISRLQVSDFSSNAQLSPDGRQVVTASGPFAKIWDAESGQEVARLPHPDRVWRAAFAANGSRVLTDCSDRRVRVWDVATGKEIASYQYKDSFRDYAFSRDGARIAVTFYGGSVHVWTAATGESVRLEHAGNTMSLAFSEDGTKLVTGAEDGTAIVWDAAKAVELFNVQHGDDILSTAFSPDGSMIVTAGKDNAARVWDSSGRQIGNLEGHRQRINSAAFSRDGFRIVTASNDGTARVWTSWTSPETLYLTHRRDVQHAAFFANDSRVVTTSPYESARIWDAITGTMLVRLPQIENRTAVSTNASSLITAASDQLYKVWDFNTGQDISQIPREKSASLSSSVAISNDGSRALTWSRNAPARVWDTSTGKELFRFEGISGGRFDPADALIVTVGEGGEVHIRNAADGSILRRLEGHRTYSGLIEFSKDGGRVVAGSHDGTAWIWDMSTGRELARLTGHRDWVYSAGFSDDGQRLVTVSSDRTARLWDVETSRELLRLGPDPGITYAALSPDGSRIATASSDRIVRIWNADTGSQTAQLEGHTGAVNGVAFSRDGLRLVTFSSDYSARIWPVFLKTTDLVKDVKTRLVRCLTPEQRRGFFLPEDPPSWCAQGWRWPFHPLSRAEALFAQKKWRDAIDAYNDAYNTIWVPVLTPEGVPLEGARLGIKLRLASAYTRQADELLEAESRNAALESMRAAEAIVRPLVPDYADYAHIQHQWGVIQSKIGLIQWKAGVLDEALTALRASAEALRRALALALVFDWRDELKEVEEQIAKLEPTGRQQVIQTARKEGRYGDALKLQAELAADVERLEVERSGKAGRATVTQLIGAAWYALLAGNNKEALSYSDRALSIDADNPVAAINRAHALLLLGRIDEAKRLYLAHKGKKLKASDGTEVSVWEQAIVTDFEALRKSGHAHPLMSELEAALLAGR